MIQFIKHYVAMKDFIDNMCVEDIPNDRHRNKIIRIIQDAEYSKKALVRLTFSRTAYLNTQSVAATVMTTMRRYFADAKYRCRQWRGRVYLVSTRIDEYTWKLIRRYL